MAFESRGEEKDGRKTALVPGTLTLHSWTRNRTQNKMDNARHEDLPKILFACQNLFMFSASH